MIHYQDKNVMVRDATETDIELWILDPLNEMRPAEVQEIWASHHANPEKALRQSFKDSIRAYTFFHKNRIAGMFGFIPDVLMGEHAQVWLLTTSEIYAMRYRFLRLTRRFIDDIRAHYPVLYNWVDARNEQCVRWLKWAGAEVFAPESFGVDKMPFHYFVIGGR